MPDVVGFRAKMGVIVPSTNTVVESDFSDMRISGVTFHTGRIYIAQPVLDSDQAFERLLDQVRVVIETAIRDDIGKSLRDRIAVLVQFDLDLRIRCIGCVVPAVAEGAGQAHGAAH